MLIIKYNLIAVVVLLLMATSGFAQKNQNEYTTIFNKKKDKRTVHGGYGSFGYGYTQIDGKDAILFNLKGAWVIDHNIALGFAGYGFFNNLQKTSNPTDYYLAGGYGGFFFEPILFSNAPVHLTVPILIGGGGVSTIPSNYWNNPFDFYDNSYDAFFVFEPGVEIEFNVVRFFRLAVGGTYRFTNGVLLENPQSGPVPVKSLDGFNVYLQLKFGKF